MSDRRGQKPVKPVGIVCDGKAITPSRRMSAMIQALLEADDAVCYHDECCVRLDRRDTEVVVRVERVAASVRLAD